MLIGITHCARAEDDLALRSKLLEGLYVLEVACERLIDENGNTCFNEGHCLSNMVIPVTALDKRDVDILCHFGKVVITLVKTEVFDEGVDLLVGAESVVIDCGIFTLFAL